MANELPNAVELYRYTRQKVYAILFDLGPKRAIAKQNPSQGKEIWKKATSYIYGKMVHANIKIYPYEMYSFFLHRYNDRCDSA